MWDFCSMTFGGAEFDERVCTAKPCDKKISGHKTESVFERYNITLSTEA